MKKTFSLKYLITIVAFFTASAVCVTAMVYQFFIVNKNNDKKDEYFKKIQEIENLVDRYYIGETNKEDLVDGLAYGYMYGINDKYAGYIIPDEAESSISSLQGLNTGMGIQISSHPDTSNIYVLEVHKSSPAEQAGIKPQDQIVSIDDKVVKDFGYTQTVDYIKSKPLNTKIHVVLKRGKEQVETNVVLTKYEMQTVFYKMVDKVGYIQITSFNDLSFDQFVEAVDNLQNNGAESLVFDLRGNGGGTLLSVYHMVDYLLPEGLIIKVKYKNENHNEVYMSDAHEVDLPMAVLTDESTASASELFSQSLKDYNKAITVGRKTYGKGVVQRTFTLSDGSLIKFTVAKYYTANGTCLDGVGVIPNVDVSWTEEELKYRLVNGLATDKDFLAAVEALSKS